MTLVFPPPDGAEMMNSLPDRATSTPRPRRILARPRRACQPAPARTILAEEAPGRSRRRHPPRDWPRLADGPRDASG